MTSTEPRSQGRGLIATLQAEWREIGGLGRSAIVGIAAAAVLTVVMGFTITNAARSNLLDARADLIETEVAALPEISVRDVPGSQAYADFDTAVRHELMGGETQRIKVWASDGRILYSDAADLVGDRFDLTAPALTAFGGDTATTISDLEDPAHEGDRAHGQLIEVYVPRRGADGAVATVVEVEQRLESLNTAMADIGRNVWLSIAIGVGVLAAFLATLAGALARAVNRRRRQSERLLGALFRSQEDERRRIIGALHDDVGQPLYRLLYGLEGSRAKLPEDDPVADELEGLEDLVRDVDGTLRGELEALHQGLAADAGLVTAISDLAATTESEADLDVHVDVLGEPERLSPVSRTALYRAAQEAVVNVRKHAGARNVWIQVGTRGPDVSVAVIDDGAGLRGDAGLGLTTTRERLEALGGGLEVTARRGGGVVFAAWLPSEAAS
jgi:signal transduction histidine kinase